MDQLNIGSTSKLLDVGVKHLIYLLLNSVAFFSILNDTSADQLTILFVLQGMEEWKYSPSPITVGIIHQDRYFSYRR